MNVSRALIGWYLKNKRDLPWRKIDDPYKIWLSEIILQQTRVEQGLPYYSKFILSYPTVNELAMAPEEDVLKLWQGLGYYSRARNLHAAAKWIMNSYKGVFPLDYQSIRSLKGVGDYTAAAISSFAFNLPYAVVDGNVYRFLSRYYGIETTIDSNTGKKLFAELAQDILNLKKPGLHNQAIMEFGSLQCKPGLPDCGNCIFNKECIAFRNHAVTDFPVKSKKLKIRSRYFNYLIIKHKNSVYLRKRPEGDIWQHLYDFPLIETISNWSTQKIITSKEWKKLIGSQSVQIKSVVESKAHKLSHQHIFTRFIELTFDTSPNKLIRSEFIEVQLHDVKKYPVPRLIEIALKDHFEDYFV
ncbi:MAG: A/G-specific adenine glycosylase [Bacteroidetes bacterium]|nr:A/G-specific adenine glycosylase [Bacteroidota bacterium]